MNYIIHGREPAAVFRYFEEICAIPHPSFHEEKLADYLVAFAISHGLEYYRDELHNVLIKKPATPGMEDRPALLLQGHTDMVCEKNADVEHDFLNDPLKLFLDGKLLGARGTTLGGDDGIAVALMLAILDGAMERHPAIECLFTIAEEVGLNGAQGFDYSRIAARRLINLDSEAIGIVTAGCAGGLRSELTLSYDAVPFAGTAIRINVKGLRGGHSGVDINAGRANANKLMGRVLAALKKQGSMHLVSLTGGSKDNAIPRECEAVVAVENAESAIQCIDTLAKALAREWQTAEPKLTLAATAVDPPATMLPADATARAVAILSNMPNGVREMNADVEGLVEWSRNLGVITCEAGKLQFVFSSRSGHESRLDAVMDELDALAAVMNCTVRHHSRYPGWSYAPVSPLRDAYLKVYREVTGKEARIDVIHAGLECGIIYSNLPDIDIISIGPDMYAIHSPDERLDLDSVEVFWKTLKALIEA